jgi:hypothetical protein
LKDDDIYAFSPAPGPAPRPPRRIWPWVLGGLLGLTLAAVAGGTLALLALADSAREGLHVVVDGERWDAPVWGVVPAVLAVLGTGGALLCALLVVLLVVPVTVGAVLLCVALGLGIVLAVALGVVLATTSPLWLLLLILWLVFRKKPGPAPAPAAAAATMNP